MKVLIKNCLYLDSDIFKTLDLDKCNFCDLVTLQFSTMPHEFFLTTCWWECDALMQNLIKMLPDSLEIDNECMLLTNLGQIEHIIEIELRSHLLIDVEYYLYKKGYSD